MLTEPLSSDQRAPDFCRPRVLVLDDHGPDLSLMETMLDYLGCDVMATSTAADALFANAVQRFDLIFLDFRLGGTTGDEVCRLMREQHSRRGDRAQVPIIACTASAMSHEIEACTAAGMDAVLLKPYFMDDLRRLVVDFTNRKGSARRH